MSTVRYMLLVCCLVAALFVVGGRAVLAAIYVETWEAEGIGDTVDQLTDWEKTYGSTYELNSRIIFTAGDNALRLNPTGTNPLGITTVNGFPGASVAGLFSIKANVKMESDGTSGTANIMVTKSTDIYNGYMLSLDPLTGRMHIVRSDSPLSQTVLGTHVAGGHNFMIWHAYQLRGRLIPFMPNDYLFLEVFVDGNDTALFSATDMAPIAFGPYLKGGMLTTGGRSAVFDDAVASISKPGDTTGDLFVTMADIPLFVQTLLDPDAASYFLRCACDVNEDAVPDGDDIQPFVDLLLE